MSWFKEILDKFSGPVVSGAAKASTKRVYHTDVYNLAGLARGDEWYFAWHDEKHEDGSILGPFTSKTDATFMRKLFVEQHPRDLCIQEGV